jgi:acyl carrier protein
MSDRELLLAEVRSFLEEERGIPSEIVVEPARWRDDLELDSLDLIEMAVEWEDRHDVRLEDDALTFIVSVGDAIDYVLARKKAPAPVGA